MSVRINKYLADNKIATRREADELITRGLVYINGVRAKLGAQVNEQDSVTVKGKKRSYRYYAYNKPRGVITHSPQGDEKDVSELSGLQGVFPVGRLDKDSHGLIILTDDGRITHALLSPDNDHDKEYRVVVKSKLPSYFKRRMEEGVNIEGYTTKPAKIRLVNNTTFFITLTEGKKHQIRRMCANVDVQVADLERTRILNIALDGLRAGQHRELSGATLAQFLSTLGLK